MCKKSLIHKKLQIYYKVKFTPCNLRFQILTNISFTIQNKAFLNN